MDFLGKDAPTVAKNLIGWQLFVREDDGSLTGGVIVETEAYMANDAASHSYRGKTPRSDVMFGPAGHIYVYFTYGMHWCCNIVTGSEGDGQAVLIRGLLPTENIETIRQRRKNQPNNQLTNGPAKICQALSITGDDNGSLLNSSRFLLLPSEKNSNFSTTATTRVGISQNKDALWRFISISPQE